MIGLRLTRWVGGIIALALFVASCSGTSSTTTTLAETSTTTANGSTSSTAVDLNASELAASVFSPDICEPVDPAAVAGIPDPVDEVSGFETSPGDWYSFPESSSLTGKRVALTVMGLGQPFFGAVADHWKDLAEAYDFDLTIYDGKFDAGTIQALVDDIIIDQPDAVAFAALASDAAVPQVKKLLDAGIPTITYNVQPAEVVAPRVIANDYNGLLVTGCNAGRYYLEKFGDTPAKIGVVDYAILPQVQDRKNGFLRGFLSVVPDAEVVSVVEGGAVIDSALPAASDLLQAYPEINVVFGINNDSTLAIAAALKAIGQYNADFGVIASIDGSAPAMQDFGNPDTPWKAESGYPPFDFAIASFNLLSAVVDGEADINTQIAVFDPAIRSTPEAIQEWLDVQYPSR